MNRIALAVGALLLVIAGVLLVMGTPAHAQSAASLGFD
jgi:hypothetical protein